MRRASREDLEFISQCIIDISLFLKSNASDIYIDGLPAAIDDNTISIASEYIQKDDAIALIAEIEGHFGKEIDLEAIDSESMTIIGPLCLYIEETVNHD